jgi:hypothetical protein
MKEVVKTLDTYALQSVKVGSETFTKYISEDGFEFDTAEECLKHEYILKNVQITRIESLSRSQLNLLIRLLFERQDTRLSSEKLFIWTPKNLTDDTEIKLVSRFLRTHDCENIEFKDVLEHYDDKSSTVFAVFSWTEDKETDYPSYCTKIVPINEVKKKLESFYQDVLQTFNF